ncbi:TSUP family transporter [Paenibacillus glycinis]|uniref:Probable membrane transporter protein n=1 Tax=Paenibacillus glycinis TaxID=2697035 RepID=A0ABW9XYN4_9BACL|nr:TSUP family transporter [Paenibacillus glycinis]NBD27847.1 TSUP family transporter [Paenibacillus glycinis]
MKQKYGYNALPALMIGGAVGLIAGLLGIGGGILLIPTMLLLFRFPPHIATATSMAVIFVSALFGSGMHLIRGEWDWFLVLSWLRVRYLAAGSAHASRGVSAVYC